MGRAPCCDKENVKRGPWSPEEDDTLRNYVQTYGTGGNWISLPQRAGLRRCGKSCRLRWLNYLRPDIKHGGFTQEEDEIICALYNQIGSKWSLIASQLPGRTDNDVKNYWNTKLKKKVLAGKSSFTNITTTTSINNIDGSVPAINNPNSLHHQAPPTTSQSQPCLPKDEITYNLDNSSSSLPILSDVGNYGFYVNLPSVPLLMQYSWPEAMFTDPTMEITTTTTTTHVANSSQEGSVISDSTETKSVSMHGNGYADDTGNILMDPFGLYDHDHFPYEVFNGLWGQEKLAAQLVVPSCYDTLADHDISQADIKPQRHV